MSIKQQCNLLGICRSSFYYKASSKQEEKDLNLLMKIKEVQILYPFYGYRKVFFQLHCEDEQTIEKKVRRVMTRFGLKAVYPGKNLSKARHENKKYPYLLKNKIIRYPNQVWSTDLTYIKLPTGSVYLMAVIDGKVNISAVFKHPKYLSSCFYSTIPEPVL